MHRVSLCLVLLGCNSPPLSGPHPESVAPARTLQQTPLAVTILGRDFHRELQADFQGDGVSSSDRFLASLDGVALDMVTFINPTTLSAIVPAMPPGTYDLTVTDPAGRSATLVAAFTVTSLPVLSIESAPGGVGSPIGDVTLRVGQQLVMFAVSRQASGAFDRDIIVDWSIDNGFASLDDNHADRVELTALAAGAGTVSVSQFGWISDATGLITAVACLGPSDCIDACHSTATCPAGSCVLGSVDKDTDSDGTLDVLCPGGTDCDDTRPLCSSDCTDGDGDNACVTNDCDDSLATGVTCTSSCATFYVDGDGDGFGNAALPSSACVAPAGMVSDATDCADTPLSDPACNNLDGAACHPGAAELCDGADNDCDLATLDGVAEPTLGQPCDGPDSDACLDDLLVCSTGSLSCNLGTNSTEGPPGDPTCSDSTDNDCDTLQDGADPGCMNTNTPPIARAVVTPPAGPLTTLFTANATSSTDRESPGSLTYAWDWEGDGTFDSTGVSATHTYPAASKYAMILAVDDPGGLRGYYRFTVVVTAAGEPITVTTAADEQDSNATPSAPGGSGLSLREAILYGEAQVGAQTVLVTPGLLITLNSKLPTLLDPAGMTLVADGAVVDGSLLTGQGACLEVGGDNNHLLGLEARNCPSFALSVYAGTGNQVERCYLHDSGSGAYWGSVGGWFGPNNEVAFNGDVGVELAAQARVTDSLIHDNGVEAIFIENAADGAAVVGNRLVANRSGIGVSNQANNLRVVHNTITGNLEDGIYMAANISGFDLRNNIIVNNGGNAVAAGNAFAFNDYNDLYGNFSGACSNCAPGPNTLNVDPQFVDSATRDLRLLPTSPTIDTGFDLGIDRNGPAPGNANRSPDMGAWEAP